MLIFNEFLKFYRIYSKNYYICKSKKQKTMYKCPTCATGFEKGTKFCQQCGCNLEEEFIETPTCPKCNKVFATGTKFCDADGERLVAPEKLIPRCVKCGKQYTDDSKFCNADGGEVVAATFRNYKNEPNNFSNTHTNTTQLNGFTMKKTTIFSLGLLVAFFLPWYFSLSGFKIPMAYDKWGSLGELFGHNMVFVKVTYILYLLPICAIYNILMDFTGNKKPYFLNEFIIGIIITGVLLIPTIVNSSPSLWGIGYYLTVIFSVLGVWQNDRKKQ